MNDGVHRLFGEDAFQGGCIVQVGNAQKLGVHGLAKAADEAVYDDDVITFIDQLKHRVGANVASAAGDKNSFHFLSVSARRYRTVPAVRPTSRYCANQDCNSG